MNFTRHSRWRVIPQGMLNELIDLLMKLWTLISLRSSVIFLERSFGPVARRCVSFDTMSRWGGSASNRWSPPSRGWGHNEWHDKNWPKAAGRNDGDSWRTDRSRRAYSESAPGPRDAAEASSRYAWTSYASSKGTASAEPVGIVVLANSSSSSTGTPLDIRRRVEDLSAAARGFPRSLEAIGDFVERAGQVARENTGVSPPAPAFEPRRAQAPRTPRPPKQRPARGHTMADDTMVHDSVGADNAIKPDLSNAAETRPCSSTQAQPGAWSDGDAFDTMRRLM